MSRLARPGRSHNSVSTASRLRTGRGASTWENMDVIHQYDLYASVWVRFRGMGSFRDTRTGQVEQVKRGKPTRSRHVSPQRPGRISGSGACPSLSSSASCGSSPLATAALFRRKRPGVYRRRLALVRDPHAWPVFYRDHHHPGSSFRGTGGSI